MLYHGLNESGVRIICIECRQAHQVRNHPRCTAVVCFDVTERFQAAFARAPRGRLLRGRLSFQFHGSSSSSLCAG
jgi:hypothetical protein